MAHPTPEEIKIERLAAFATALDRVEHGDNLFAVMDDIQQSWQTKTMKDLVRSCSLPATHALIDDIQKGPSDDVRSTLTSAFLHASGCRPNDKEHLAAWLMAIKPWWFTQKSSSTKHYVGEGQKRLDVHFAAIPLNVNPSITQGLKGLVVGGFVDVAWDLRTAIASTAKPSHAQLIEHLDANLLLSSLKDKSARSCKRLLDQMGEVSDVAWQVSLHAITQNINRSDHVSKKVITAVLDKAPAAHQEKMLSALLTTMLHLTRSFHSQSVQDMLAALIVHRLNPSVFSVFIQEVKNSARVSAWRSNSEPIHAFALALSKNNQRIVDNALAIDDLVRHHLPALSKDDVRVQNVWQSIHARAQRQLLTMEVNAAAANASARKNKKM